MYPTLRLNQKLSNLGRGYTHLGDKVYQPLSFLPFNSGPVQSVWKNYLQAAYGTRLARRKSQQGVKENSPESQDITSENFADGKKPGRKGLAKRVGVNCKQSVSKLRSIAANSSGERQRMAHWCANMKSGRNK